MRLTAILIVALLAMPVLARTPAFDPLSFKRAIAGPPTQVLVLGTAHLSELPKTFAAANLASVLDRLTTFAPTIITIEALPGQSCDTLTRYAALYPGVAADYCRPTDVARAATGLDSPAAEAAIAKSLSAWPAEPTPAQRRRLLGAFMAAGDQASAVVQWLRLPAAERRVGDGIDVPLLGEVTAAAARMNENVAIAATLAARLGLERVYPTDDHSADSIQAAWGPEAEASMKLLWSGDSPMRADYVRLMAGATNPQGTLDLYRHLNKPATVLGLVDADQHAAMRQDRPGLYGRQYAAWWEARNLRMVASVRAAFGTTPGARVLAIVGASHKSYFDAYLNLMHDVRLVDAEAVLK